MWLLLLQNLLLSQCGVAVMWYCEVFVFQTCLLLWDLQVWICYREVFINKINYVPAAAIYCVAVMYCSCDFILFGFSYFPFVSCNKLHMLHPAQLYSNISIRCCEVKFSWTVTTVLFIALQNSLMVMQSSEALLFYKICLLRLCCMSLEMCIFTHSLVVDHIG